MSHKASAGVFRRFDAGWDAMRLLPGPSEKRMHIEGVAIIPRCAECEAVWRPSDEARW